MNSILAKGLDAQAPTTELRQDSLPLHDNVRGPDYFSE